MRQHQPCHQTNPIDHVHVWHCRQKADRTALTIRIELAQLWARAAHSVVVAEALWQAQLSACANSVVVVDALWQARLSAPAAARTTPATWTTPATARLSTLEGQALDVSDAGQVDLSSAVSTPCRTPQDVHGTRVLRKMARSKNRS